MKRSIIVTGLLGLLFIGQPAQAAIKISSGKVGELQAEYKKSSTSQTRKDAILKQISEGGYPAVAAQLQSAKPTKVGIELSEKESNALEYLRELFKEEEEVKQNQAEVKKSLADVEKEKKELEKQQAKKREEEGKRLAALEAERKKLEQQKNDEEERKKANELAAAKEKQLEEELRREQEAAEINKEQERLAAIEKTLEEKEIRIAEKKRNAEKEAALIKKQQEQQILREKKEQERKAQEQVKAEEAKRLEEQELEAKNQRVVESNKKFFEEEKKRGESSGSAGSKPKELMPTPAEIAKVENELKNLKNQTLEAKRAYLSQQILNLQEMGKQSSSLYIAYKAEYDKLGGIDIPKISAEEKKKAEEKRKADEEQRRRDAQAESQQHEKVPEKFKKQLGETIRERQMRQTDPQASLNDLLNKANQDTPSHDLKEQQKAQYVAVKKEIARINGIVEKNAITYGQLHRNDKEVMHDSDGNSYILIQEPFFDDEYRYYQLLNNKQEILYNVSGVGGYLSGTKQPIYIINERYTIKGPNKSPSIAQMRN